ncbi:DUF1285 domain-containing protein [Pacificispira spongiicola]|nr:DUF1285 domain-containing protein [Pacificispira spongiicola]
MAKQPPYPKSDRERKSLKDLMERGEGLSGFAWPKTYTDFDMRILRDGTWTYRGGPIRRMKLCQLFATVLQRDENGDYWLVTPVERGRIQVDDAPFVAVAMTEEKDADGNPVLRFRTNLDHWVTADADHPIRVTEDPETGEPSPYIHIRDGLDALIARPIFYDMVERAETVETATGSTLVLDSAGQRFTLGHVDNG